MKGGNSTSSFNVSKRDADAALQAEGYRLNGKRMLPIPRRRLRLSTPTLPCHDVRHEGSHAVFKSNLPAPWQLLEEHTLDAVAATTVAVAAVHFLTVARRTAVHPILEESVWVNEAQGKTQESKLKPSRSASDSRSIWTQSPS